jgi:DNA (cytosine-5)-methyltransferase 1
LTIHHTYSSIKETNAIGGTTLIYTAISLFSGAGGLDYGFEAAGFETVAAIEMDPYCCLTLQVNRPDWGLIQSRLESVASSEILDVAGLKKRQPDILYGGPPCQPFSKAGFWHSGDVKRLKDPRSVTLREFFRVLEDTLPRAFLIENVSGFVFEDKDEGLRLARRRIAQINQKHGTKYSLAWKILNSADYGVPQIRERVFIVGSRDGIQFNFPAPTHCDSEASSRVPGESNLEPYLTAWDALHDLDDISEVPDAYRVSGKWALLLPTIPEGENYLFHTARGNGAPLFKWRSRYWNFLLKLAKDRPSWTIQAQPGPAIGPFHWKNRKLTMRELARLQTFPEDISVLGNEREIHKQIGNAVPSAMGELLGREIRSQFFGDKRTRRPLSLLPQRTNKKPTPKRTQRPSPGLIRKMEIAHG